MEHVEIILSVIKEQVKLYLLDAGEFFPFGTYIDRRGDIKPFSAFLEHRNDQPSSLELIGLLESYIDKNLSYIIAAIAIDVTIKENGESVDAVEVRFFEGNRAYTKHLKYVIQTNDVKFF